MKSGVLRAFCVGLDALARASLVVALAGCGYRTLYGGGASAAGGDASPRLHVVLARSIVPDAVASDEVVSGAREELLREGALAAGDGYPRIEIEVLRIDESSDAIAAVPATGTEAGGDANANRSGAAASRVPRARASEVGLVARAWVVLAAGGEPVRDTGDVRAIDLAATDPPARAAPFGAMPGGSMAGDATEGAPFGGAGADRRDAFRHEDAVRAVARRVGARLARRILGNPAALDEAMGRER